ncbi:DEAD/DEAH box helicase [Candidatus Dojkabacteria bacterium]|nr:DEAD/DEAH box helicase [Candidatus Dojkabacteria bacterium]
MKLQDKVSTIPLIGPKYAEVLASIDVHTLEDMLKYYPRDHFDSSKLVSLDQLSRTDKKAFKATVNTFKNTKTRKRGLTIQTAIIEDGTDAIEVIWFNQPFLENTIEEGKDYIFIGKLNPKKIKPQIMAPEFEKLKSDEKQTHVGIISPIYPLTKGISNKWLRSRMKWLVEKLDYITDIEDFHTKEFLDRYNLLDIKETIKQIHFPKSQRNLNEAKHRLGFDELLEIHKKIIKKEEELSKLSAHTIKTDQKATEKMLDELPYQLTKDQKNAYKEVLNDLRKDTPGRRLLSGDVGSGKTIVAIIGALNTTLAGSQSIILAPTTVLANQHYETIQNLLDKSGLNIRLVTSTSTYDKNDADILIGTHAILHKKDKLISEKLALLVIDEQHRFGVKQREEIQQFLSKSKGNSPHLLSMTATPIPRTLALTLFSDMQVSTIKTKPKKRKTTQTHLVPNDKREDSFDWLKKRIKKGTQVFWIAPLIEENQAIQATSIKEIEKEIKSIFSETHIATLHGKLKSDEKDKILEDFRNFETSGLNILLSTSVIEVGIDIPNANIIIIEGAERFGLAQLHQLRGRVGRGAEESWCFLFTSDPPNEEQSKRLKYFCEESDGFKIAEYDLKRRGPGEVYGTRQAGIPDLRYANLFDLEMVKQTRKAAEELL